MSIPYLASICAYIQPLVSGRRNLERYSYIALALKLDEALHRKGIANISKAVSVANGLRHNPTFPILEKLEIIPSTDRINSVKEVAKISHASTGTVAKVKSIVLLREVTTNPHGGDHTSADSKNNNVIIGEVKQGNSKAYSLDRLKRML